MLTAVLTWRGFKIGTVHVPTEQGLRLSRLSTHSGFLLDAIMVSWLQTFISTRLILLSNHRVSLLETPFPDPLEKSVN